MTTTQDETTNAAPAPDAASLQAMTRAELLELCKAAGLKATAWKRERMLEALLAGEKPAAKPAPGTPKLAAQAPEADDEGESEKPSELALAERLNYHVGKCGAINCKKACEQYEPAADGGVWKLCTCMHSKQVHELVDAPASLKGPKIRRGSAQ